MTAAEPTSGSGEPGHLGAGHVVATAGHVDHGKSTLVRSLTGVEPDRFEEERRRGLTIDLGFASTDLPSGRQISFVDVPGHVRFLGNMLAGVGAVERCLFVVAATEGWKPQSEEHLRIVELLGLTGGVVALTKTDLVDDDTRALAALEVAERLAGTVLEDAELIEVAAPAGAGLAELRAALDRLLDSTPVATDRRRARLWVDRVFAATGSGTVVTGTSSGGTFSVGDDVRVVTASGERTARVRGLETHGTTRKSVGPGHRLAINLAGVSRGDIRRGDAVVHPNQWEPAKVLDCSVRVLAALDHDLSRRGAHVVHVGSGEHPASIRVLGPDAIAPGHSGNIRIHLPRLLPLVPGDRFVLRESGRGETVGGGEVLDVAPTLPASRARPDRSVDRVVAERGWVDAAHLARLTGVERTPDAGRWVVDAQLRRRIVDDLDGRLESAGPRGLDPAALDERQRALVELDDRFEITAGRILRRGALQSRDRHPWVTALLASPYAPPPPDDVDRGALRDLIAEGAVVERDGMYFASEAVAGAAETMADLLATAPDGVTVSQFREALGTTRKYVLPLVSLLDATGVTRRRGELRIAGPRLPHRP